MHLETSKINNVLIDCLPRMCTKNTRHLIVGTETWFTPDISSSEFLPADLGYSIFREDRTTSNGGGVFILVKDSIIASEQNQFKTDCQVVWVKIELVGTKPL